MLGTYKILVLLFLFVPSATLFVFLRKFEPGSDDE